MAGDVTPPFGDDAHYHGTELFSPNINPEPLCNEPGALNPFVRM